MFYSDCAISEADGFVAGTVYDALDFFADVRIHSTKVRTFLIAVFGLCDSFSTMQCAKRLC